MRAVQLSEIGKALTDADVTIPEIGSSDVLIRVATAGICHSDAHYRAGISKIDRLPLTLGHEVDDELRHFRDVFARFGHQQAI